ncbi:MAG: hypothetical protein IKQ20_00430, partial [Bacteroidales bacterium]|nr:hypothetical protein [Bacteroidales bacterium]
RIQIRVRGRWSRPRCARHGKGWTVAQGQISKSEKEKPKPVTCRRCRHFLLDTKGISYNVYTKVYFMGVCLLGRKPDSPIKQFADRERLCKGFQD